MKWASRASAGVTFFTMSAVVGCAVVPLARNPAGAETALRRPDPTSAGIDLMPVGTARQMARVKQARSARKG